MNTGRESTQHSSSKSAELRLPATVPIPLRQDIPDNLRRSIRLSARPRPKYKELSSRVRWQEPPSLGSNPGRCVQRSASSYSPTALQQRDGLPADETTLATSADGAGGSAATTPFNSLESTLL